LIPITLVGLPDRLGNILVQLPVNVLVAKFSRTAEQLTVSIGWHHNANPRPVRASVNAASDNTLSGFASAEIQKTEVSFPWPSRLGRYYGTIWDDHNQVVLAAMGGTTFIEAASINTSIVDREPRAFRMPTKQGTEDVRIETRQRSAPVNIGIKAPPAGDWTQRRIFRDAASRLAAERIFVQYKPEPGQQQTKHQDALQDVRHLLEAHGELGAWLWDPYLTAADILKTLFHNPHAGADMRALTAAAEIPTREPDNNSAWSCLVQLARQATSAISGGQPATPPPSFVERQRAALDDAGSNFRGLRLEFRIKSGQAGWLFHDRFLIFPKEEGRALAWSLGTSVNSLGNAHHILQQVDDGRLVMDAFLELWNVLHEPEYLIWKVP
jgi:hypothetical protein